MPNQTIVVADTANDGTESGGWFTTGFANINYVGGTDYIGFSFVLTTSIPAGSTILPSYLRCPGGSDVSGSSTVEIGFEDVDPGTNTVWSGTHLPAGATVVTAAQQVGPVTWAADTAYFGLGDAQATNLAAQIQELVDTFGGIASGERVNIRLRHVSGTGYLGVDDLSAPDEAFAVQLFIDWSETAPIVDSVTPSTFNNAQTGIVVAGSNFQATQGTGRVVISPVDDIDGEVTIAPSFVSNALGGTTTTTTFSITLPTTAANDLILLEFCHRGTGDGTIAGTYTGPAFALQHSQLFATSAFSGKLYWSRASGNHAGETVTGASLTDSCAAIVTVYRDVIATGNPFTGAATIVGEQNASGNETQAEITTLVANCMVCLTVLNSPDLAVAGQTATNPATLIERAERLSTGGTDASVAHASEVRTTAGATGALNWTQTNAASGSYAFALQPRAALGAAIDQTVTAWSDTSITFTAVQSTLSTGINLYLFVEADDNTSNSAGEVVQFSAFSMLPAFGQRMNTLLRM